MTGDNEPHNGFKLFVVDDTARGLWWRLTFHQGSGRPNRAFTHFHSLDLLVHRAADGQKYADVHLMADTGGARKKCDKSTVILPGDFFKSVPTDDCLTDFYESWPTRLQVGTLFRYSGSIDIDNAITAISRNADGSWSDTRVVYVASVMSNPCEPLDAHADCNRLGDKRSVIAPRLFMQNTTRDDTIRTDHLGNIVASGGIVQFLLRDETIDQGQTTNFANGIDGGDRMIYRPLASCTDTGDCNPRNFSDGTVTPPN